MKLLHHNIQSSVFELVGTYEIDIDLTNENNEDQFSLRIELFRSLSQRKVFRYRTWRNELFRIQSTFPQDKSGKALHDQSDEMILVGLSLREFGPAGEIVATSVDAALRKVVETLGKALEHITSEKLKIRR